MNIHRPKFQQFDKGPVCQIYGKKINNNNAEEEYLLIAPLELVQKSDNSFMKDVAIPKNKIPIRNDGSGSVGVIREFDWQSLNLNGKPVVYIQPHKALDIKSIFDVTKDKDSPPKVSEGDEIKFEYKGELKGTVKKALSEKKAFENWSSEVEVFLCEFDSKLDNLHHGSRVIISSSSQSLGMLIATQKQVSGRTLAYVFPAHLI